MKTTQGAKGLAGEPGDECLCLPTTERRHIEKVLTDGAASMQAGYVCLHRCLVNKDLPLRSFPREGLATHYPVMSGQPYPPARVPARLGFFI